jgi:peptidoglycan/xylan/chitin deacetylase (PgdA/CDA1 family)
MRKIIIIVSGIIVLGILIFFIFYESGSSVEMKDSDYCLPKVLYVTTGSQAGNGSLAEGVVIALQTFNKEGALVRLNSREILYKPELLREYKIMILSTAINYHDADRQYSLTFLSDNEIENIRRWVEEGGILVAGDNVGRNYLDATDRLSVFGKITPENWGLGKCFGLSLIEKNLRGFKVIGNINDTIKGEFISFRNKEKWALVIDSVYSGNAEILANWESEEGQTYPAIVKNEYGSGSAYLLPSSYLLHPSNVGGYWSAKEIELFYKYIIREFYKNKKYAIQLSPWPNACDGALCISFNAAGSEKEFERVLKLLKKEKIKADVFVNGTLEKDIKSFLIKSNIDLESNAYSKVNYRDLDFATTMHDIMMNETFWNTKFKGFRFPFTYNSAWGMLCLDQLGYLFDSSIGADNTNEYYGSVFPYNIPISTDEFFKTLELLEISPTFHDDYYFYSQILDETEYTIDQQQNDAKLFEQYLINYWKYSTKPYSGAMIFIGHPMYTGYSDITTNPLKTIINKVKEDNGWITTMEELAEYWNGLQKLTFSIKEGKNKIQIKVSSKNTETLNNITLKLEERPESIYVNDGNYKVVERSGKWYVVFNAQNMTIVEISL